MGSRRILRLGAENDSRFTLELYPVTEPDGGRVCDDLLHFAIGWVKEHGEDGAHFLPEVAVVLEMLVCELPRVKEGRSHEGRRICKG
jgi:hypothetical protein